ncbi:MAG: 16S rRNA (cytosine(1402)-N(4))-methyltransferase, partial [Patescibacteria group bacterium]|nr:16S rRNA (cytosine(1402)-N(4))-methyltransferase [Patescibacteria group bacterium]
MTHALTSTRVRRHLTREEGGSEREWNSGHTAAHQSVLPKEVVDLLNPQKGELVVDATVGASGHSEALLKAAHIKLIALDADLSAVEATRARLKRFGERAVVVEANFADLEKVLKEAGLKTVHAVLFDLGWRQEQRTSGKGFSFLHNEPLTMSYGEHPRSGFTAEQILNLWDEHV